MRETRPTDASKDTTLQVGQVVAGTYRIERLIAKGGMAAVWEATSQRTGKRVALKAMLGELEAEEEAVEMLRREAVAASRINHPNIVNIYDVVEHAGLPCIVMEMLDGEPLSTYLARQGFLGVEEAVTLLLPAMRGVAAANAVGVIHRDLKPKNIFICSGGDGRMLTTKVLDFGIAIMPENGRGSPPPEQALPIHGTPAYMSPEHIHGWADLDGRADVYGFGVLFFEVLTGQVPFAGPPGSDLLRRIVKDPPPRITELRPELPSGLADIVGRALAKNREDRFPNLDAFIAAVEAYLPSPAQLPRALTPMGGVPLFSHSQPKSGVPAPRGADGALETASPTSSDTRKLYAIPVERIGEPTAPRRIGVAQTVSPAGAEPRSTRASRRRKPRWARHLGALFLFGGMLWFVVWLAFPNLPVMDDAEETTGTRAGPATTELPTPGTAGVPAQALVAPDGGTCLD